MDKLKKKIQQASGASVLLSATVGERADICAGQSRIRIVSRLKARPLSVFAFVFFCRNDVVVISPVIGQSITIGFQTSASPPS